MRQLLSSVLALSFLATLAPAQFGGPPVGIFIFDATGANAGQACTGTNCTPHDFSTTGGTALTIRAMGSFNAPYLMGYSGLPAGCQTFPTITNPLLLQAPAITMYGGITSGLIPTTCSLAGDDRAVTVPLGLPPGIQFIVQGLVLDPNVGGVLTAGIRVTVN